MGKNERKYEGLGGEGEKVSEKDRREGGSGGRKWCKRRIIKKKREETCRDTS